MEKENMMQAVIFDMDGVLLDSESLWIDCWADTAAEYDPEEIRKCLLASIGTTAQKTKEIFLEEFGENFPYDRFGSEASGNFKKAEAEGRLVLKPGAEEILSFLHENGIRTALATSTEMNTAKRQMQERGLFPYFDKLVFGSQIARSKPAPDIFLKAAEMLETEPENCWVIEDSFNGIRAAHAAGMHPVMVPDLLQPDEQTKAMCEAVLPDLHAAAEWLRERLG